MYCIDERDQEGKPFWPDKQLWGEHGYPRAEIGIQFHFCGSHAPFLALVTEK